MEREFAIDKKKKTEKTRSSFSIVVVAVAFINQRTILGDRERESDRERQKKESERASERRRLKGGVSFLMFESDCFFFFFFLRRCLFAHKRNSSFSLSSLSPFGFCSEEKKALKCPLTECVATL